VWSEQRAQPFSRKFDEILCIKNAFFVKNFFTYCKMHPVNMTAPTLNLPLVKDFKTELAVFPAENQPKISSAETQPEKNFG